MAHIMRGFRVKKFFQQAVILSLIGIGGFAIGLVSAFYATPTGDVPLPEAISTAFFNFTHSGRQSENVAIQGLSAFESGQGRVLSAHEDVNLPGLYRLDFNLPARFAQPILFQDDLTLTASLTISQDLSVGQTLEVAGELISGSLTAPNVVYSLQADDDAGLEIEGVQDLLITNTDKGSDQDIFKTIKVGSTSFDAGSNTDTLTFEGTSGVSVDIDTTNKKLTFKASATDLNVSGWTTAGSLVYLGTSTDNVAIGGASNLAKFSVTGDTDEIQFRVRGNSTQTSNLAAFEQSDGTDLLAIDNNGNLTFSPTSFSNPITLYSSDTSFSSSDTGIVDAVNTAYTAAIGGGGGLWTLTSGVVYPTTTTNDLALGGSTSSAPFFYDESAEKLFLTGTTGAQLRLAYDGTNYADIALASDGGLTWTASGTDADFAIDLTGATDGDFSINGNHLFVDTSTGSVGIGTTVPEQEFHVLGSGAKIAVLESANSDAFIELRNKDGTSAYIGNDGVSRISLSSGSYTADHLKILSSGEITLSGDTDTYWSLPAANTFAWTTAGTEALRIDTNQRVGVGTTSPQSLLHVGSAGSPSYIDGTDDVYIYDDLEVEGAIYDTSGLTVSGFWQQDSGALYPYTSTLDVLFGGTSTTSAAFSFVGVDSSIRTATISGNLALSVPIGADPATTLDILDGGTFNLRASVGGDEGLSSAIFVSNNGNIGFGTDTPGEKFEFRTDQNTIQGLQLKEEQGDVFAFLGDRSATGEDGILKLFDDGAETIRLSAHSNTDSWINTREVGIGTTSPGATLDVLRGDTSTAFRATTSTGYMKFSGQQLNIQESSNEYGGYIYARGTGVGSLEIETLGISPLLLGTNNGTQRAIFDDSGNVGLGGAITDNSTFEGASAVIKNGNFGIGTTDPTSLLHVDGAVTGKALAIFNETGDQDIFTASSSGSPKFVIGNSGQVGIGTTNPNGTLEVGSGQILIPDGIAALPAIAFSSDVKNGIYGTDQLVAVSVAGNRIAQFDASKVLVEKPIKHNYSGAESSPAYTFNGDPDIGMFRVTANTLALSTSGSEALRIDPSSNIGIGTTNQFGSGTGVLALGNAGTNPTTTLTDASLFYASAGEMYVYDAAGNATLISPHDIDTGLWVYTSTNTVTGKTLTVEMEKLVKDLDKLLGGGYVFENGNQSYSGSNLILALQEELLRSSNISTTQATASSEINDGQQILDELANIKKLAESYEDEIDSLKGRVETLEDLNLAAASSELQDTVDKQATFDSLLVLGSSTLGDTVVNGKLDVGIISFDNLAGSIDVIGNLKLQPKALGSVELVGNKVEIDEKGNLKIKEGVLEGSDKMRGVVELLEGQTTFTVEVDWEESPVSVFFTPSYNADIWIVQKSEGGFQAALSPAPEAQAEVGWLAIW